MKTYIEELKKALDRIAFWEVELLIKLIRKANIVWIIGNGGSACTAEHLAEDLIKMTFKKAVAVTSSSLLLMSGNDEGFENAFLYPLSRLVNKKDLVLGITIGGKSKNILNVMDCEDLECKKFLITGLGGKDLKVNKIVIQSSDYQIAEDVCLTICHNICKYYGSVK